MLYLGFSDGIVLHQGSNISYISGVNAEWGLIGFKGKKGITSRLLMQYL